MSDASGQSLSSTTYYPFGETRTGSVSTDKKFTGQREDGTGLYYYNARYYDPEIGRFISADTVVKDYNIPQTLGRYSYAINNPLRYTDPTGHVNIASDDGCDTEQEPPNVYTLVWGYADQWDYCFNYYHSVMVFIDQDGNYFYVETWGMGGSFGIGYSSSIFEPGQTFTSSEINDMDTIGLEASIGGTFLTWQFSLVSVSVDKTGFDPDGPKENKNSYLAFTSPGPDIKFMNTTISQVSPSEAFKEMPLWVTVAYNKYFGTDYEWDLDTGVIYD